MPSIFWKTENPSNLQIQTDLGHTKVDQKTSLLLYKDLETLETETEISKVLNTFIQYENTIKQVKITVWISQKACFMKHKLNMEVLFLVYFISLIAQL